MTLFNLVKKCVIKWCVTFYFTNWINFPNRIEPPSAWRIHRVALLTNSGGEKESNGMRPNRTASASSRVSPTQVENGGRSRRCVLSSIAGARKETEGSAALISNNQLSPPPSLSPSLFWSSRVERKRKIQKVRESATVAILVWFLPGSPVVSTSWPTFTPHYQIDSIVGALRNCSQSVSHYSEYSSRNIQPTEK